MIDDEQDNILFGNKLSLLESVQIIKYVNASLDNYHHLPILKDFSSCNYSDETEQYTFIDFEEYTDTYFEALQEYILESFTENFTNCYDEIKRVIRAIAIVTDIPIENITNRFKDLLVDIKEHTKYEELDYKLNEHREIETLLRKQGAKNVQTYSSYDGCETLVRYEFPKSNNTYELMEKSFTVLKQELFDQELSAVRKKIEDNLANITKEYDIIGTDEQLTEHQRRDALYNTFKNIEKGITVINRHGEDYILTADMIMENLHNLQNSILGNDSTKYQTGLLMLMRKAGLHQISRNEKGQCHYVGLFKILVDYYDLLGGFKVNLENLKYLDNTLTDSRNKLLNINGIKSYSMNKWYDFYKIAKNKYKKGNLYSVYFSYLQNTKSITSQMFKKIFKIKKFKDETINIYHLPPLHI